MEKGITVSSGYLRYFSILLVMPMAGLVSCTSVRSGSNTVIPNMNVRAASGDAEAIYGLAMKYQRGMEISLDLTSARQWLEKAAYAGSTQAMDRLGMMYAQGESGVASDYDVAFRWFQREADHGGCSGAGKLALLQKIRNALKPSTNPSTNTPSETLLTTQRDSQSGDPAALNAMGLIYQHGLAGAKQNIGQAIAWYRKAADAGNIEAMWSLGDIYWGCWGVPKDDKRAMAWFRKAADLGDADGMEMVGELTSNGQGVVKSEKEAIAWFRKAAERGNGHAMYEIGYMYENGVVVNENHQLAMAWYQKGAGIGNYMAMISIGELYGKGVGVQKDERAAARWYRMADEARVRVEGVAADDFNGAL